jgi:hypothetical protein
MIRICISCITGLLLLSIVVSAQSLKSSAVPQPVKDALLKDYPTARSVKWEREKGNYEANWGGRSGEDNSVLFKPDGVFIEKVVAIPVSGLPKEVAAFVQKSYPGAKITEAGKVTDAEGRTKYEAEVRGKDLLFDENGGYLGKD